VQTAACLLQLKYKTRVYKHLQDRPKDLVHANNRVRYSHLSVSTYMVLIFLHIFIELVSYTIVCTYFGDKRGLNVAAYKLIISIVTVLLCQRHRNVLYSCGKKYAAYCNKNFYDTLFNSHSKFYLHTLYMQIQTPKLFCYWTKVHQFFFVQRGRDN